MILDDEIKINQYIAGMIGYTYHGKIGDKIYYKNPHKDWGANDPFLLPDFCNDMGETWKVVEYLSEDYIFNCNMYPNLKEVGFAERSESGHLGLWINLHDDEISMSKLICLTALKAVKGEEWFTENINPLVGNRYRG